MRVPVIAQIHHLDGTEFLIERVVEITDRAIRVVGRPYTRLQEDSLYRNRCEVTVPWDTIDHIRWRVSRFPGTPGGDLVTEAVVLERRLNDLEARLGALEEVEERVGFLEGELA